MMTHIDTYHNFNNGGNLTWQALFYNTQESDYRQAYFYNRVNGTKSFHSINRQMNYFLTSLTLTTESACVYKKVCLWSTRGMPTIVKAFHIVAML